LPRTTISHGPEAENAAHAMLLQADTLARHDAYHTAAYVWWCAGRRCQIHAPACPDARDDPHKPRGSSACP